MSRGHISLDGKKNSGLPVVNGVKKKEWMNEQKKGYLGIDYY
jgi:hypothetical protein